MLFRRVENGNLINFLVKFSNDFFLGIIKLHGSLGK